jgi:hypothetical protein
LSYVRVSVLLRLSAQFLVRFRVIRLSKISGVITTSNAIGIFQIAAGLLGVIYAMFFIKFFMFVRVIEVILGTVTVFNTYSLLPRLRVSLCTVVIT